MKKLFLLTCVVLTTLVSIAQTKKVAILEVLDRENKLTYSQKLMLRSNMARAIANTNGYEAYDRSDVDMIMSEQDFQRTGYVSNDQIRKLGEMTGVSLILVTEGALTRDGKIFVSAKILNVETGRVDITDNITMGLESTAIQQGCNTLTGKLFGVGTIASQSSKYHVAALSGNYYSYRGQTMDEKAYMNFLRNNCPRAFAAYHKGRAMTISGWVAFGAGLAITGVGAGFIIVGNHNYKVVTETYTTQIEEERAYIDKIKNTMYNKYGSNWSSKNKNNTEIRNALNKIDDYYAKIKLLEQQLEMDPDIEEANGFKNAGIGMVVVGPVLTGASVPLLYFGYKTKKQSVNIYNDNCASSSAKTFSLNLTSGYNGIGLALKF